MAGTFAAIAGLAVLTSLVYTGNYRGVDLHGTHEQYLRIMNARQHIENQRKGAPILFWYDKQEMPDYFEYYALNASYLAEFSRISENFPRGCSGPVEPGTLVVVTSEQEHSADLAQTALTDCWRPFGVRPTVASVEAIRADRRTYTMTMLKVEPAASTMPAPGESFKSVPLEQMKLGDPHVVLRSTPEGIELQTLRGFGAFAGRVKLRLDSSLPEKLAVLVRLRVIDGKVFVGILNTKSNGFLVNTPVWPLPRDLDVILPLPSPPVTGDLIISNARPNKLISKVLVEKIEIRQLP
jgi:hypothetical protein